MKLGHEVICYPLAPLVEPPVPSRSCKTLCQSASGVMGKCGQSLFTLQLPGTIIQALSVTELKMVLKGQAHVAFNWRHDAW